MKQNKAQSQVLQFRLSVLDVKPEIWRLMLVSIDITLARLHEILQILMGWQNHHLYAFVIDGKRYAPHNEIDGDKGKSNLIGTNLSSLFKKNAKDITYEYDFGDRWEIELHVESTKGTIGEELSAECIEGGRHGPVEDSGGSRGYMEKIKIFRNPQYKSYQQMREWIGPKFDPEAFSLAEANELLKTIG
jgi:hypothetical protein